MEIIGGWFSKKIERLEQRLSPSDPGQLDRERERCFAEIGSTLLEELITSCKGRCRCNPIRNFSAKQVLEATEHFKSSFRQDGLSQWYKGALDGRPVLIKKHENYWKPIDYSCRDIAINSHMSAHKNVLKLLGCCLAFSDLMLVYENAENGPLNISEGTESNGLALSWNLRLKIAKDIANAITYLHQGFPRPIVHRDIKESNIFLDVNCVPKLCNFGLAISIPEGETQVKDLVKGTFGYVDPHYVITETITEKTDVYSFGVLLLVLVTGRKAMDTKRPEHEIIICRYVLDMVENDQYNEIVDLKIWEEEAGGVSEEHRKLQLRAFIELALRCTKRGAGRKATNDRCGQKN